MAKSSDNASNKTENDEVHLKVPIPMFNLLTHKLFDSKGFGSQTPKLTPRSKLGMKVDDFKTPINKPPNDRALTGIYYSFNKTKLILTGSKLTRKYI